MLQEKSSTMSKNARLSLKKIRYSLLQLGVEAGQIVMLHASLRTMGRLEGGPRGLLDEAATRQKKN